jgi:hypothetical protein
MTSRLIALCAAAFGLLSAATAANAGILHYEAILRGAYEAPPNATPGKGEIVAEVDTDRRVIDYTVTYAGLTGPATTAGLHEVAADQSDPVITSPVSGPAGQIHVVTRLTDDQLRSLAAGRWFFDIGTAANPSGEIRGQLRRTSNF